MPCLAPIAYPNPLHRSSFLLTCLLTYLLHRSSFFITTFADEAASLFDSYWTDTLATTFNLAFPLGGFVTSVFATILLSRLGDREDLYMLLVVLMALFLSFLNLLPYPSTQLFAALLFGPTRTLQWCQAMISKPHMPVAHTRPVCSTHAPCTHPMRVCAHGLCMCVTPCLAGLATSTSSRCPSATRPNSSDGCWDTATWYTRLDSTRLDTTRLDSARLDSS